MSAVHSRPAAWGIVVTFLVLGVLLAMQFRTHQSARGDLQRMPVDELTMLVGALNKETDRLQEEVTGLQLQVLSGRYAHESDADQMRQQRQNLEELQLVTGTVPGSGAGVLITVADGSGQVGAYELTDLLNELRSAAARAIVVDGARVDFASGFADGQEGVLLSGKLLATPYLIGAVGDSEELASALLMPGGLVSRFESLPGVEVEVERHSDMSMPSVRTLVSFEHASRAGR